MKRVLFVCVGWLLACVLWCLRATCRYVYVGDVRPALREKGVRYVFALYHAHHVAALCADNNPVLATMVSRSYDGQLLIPSLKVCGVDAVRGSTRSSQKDKGGKEALDALGRYLHDRGPVLLTVDGPRGPRGCVHRGIVALAAEQQAVIVPLTVVASRYWMLGSWDRLQIPKPFSKVYTYWGTPLDPSEYPSQQACREHLAQVLKQYEDTFLV